MKAGSKLILIVALLVSIPMVTYCDSHRKVVDLSDIHTMAAAPDLVAIGIIASVTTVELPVSEVIGGPRHSSVIVPVTEIAMEITEIVAGEYSGEIVTFIWCEGANEESRFGTSDEMLIFHEGEKVLVALIHNALGYDRYRLMWRDGIFRTDGESLIPYAKEYAIDVDKPLDELRKASYSRKFKYLIAESDLICVATLHAADIGLSMLEFEIVELLKSQTEPITAITINDPTFSFYQEDIYDYHYLLFLSKGTHGYNLATKQNSVYTVIDDKIIRSFNTEMVTTVTTIKKEIDVWKQIKEE